jgi:hypothetical protein
MIDSITMTWTPVIYVYAVDTAVLLRKLFQLILNICGRIQSPGTIYTSSSSHDHMGRNG